MEFFRDPLFQIPIPIPDKNPKIWENPGDFRNFSLWIFSESRIPGIGIFYFGRDRTIPKTPESPGIEIFAESPGFFRVSRFVFPGSGIF